MQLRQMVAYCEGNKCRRQTLMEYFGEKLPDFCGNCDSCLRPKSTFDGTEAARKLISCVQDLNQRFGTNYIIDVLTGSKNKKIRQNRHERLKSHGSGQEFTKEQWKSLVSEMTNTGLLDVSGAQYPVLKLNAMSRKILKDPERIELVCPEGFVPEAKGNLVHSMGEDIEETRTKNNIEFPAEELLAGGLSTEEYSTEKFSAAADILKTSKVRKALKSEKGPDPILFERLKALRKEIALKKNLPPYIIFSDTTLKEMAARFPQSSEELHSITGVGDHKLRKYGDIFLAEIEHYCRDYDLLTAGKAESSVPADKESDNNRIIPKSTDPKNEGENSGVEVEIEALGIKVPILESDYVKSSEVCRLPAKRTRYLDMSIQDWSGTDYSAENSMETVSIESSPEPEVLDLLKTDLFKANSHKVDSNKAESSKTDSFEAESIGMNSIEAESYKTDSLKTNSLEMDSLQRTYSLYIQGLKIDQIAEIQSLSTGAVLRQFEQMILTGKVKDIGELLHPERQQQIKAILEMLETELDALIRAKMGEGYQKEELQFIRALLLSRICFSQS